MSTRTSRVLVGAGATALHLYDEMHDGQTHLEISHAECNLRLNLIVPALCVADLEALLRRADQDDGPHRHS